MFGCDIAQTLRRDAGDQIVHRLVGKDRHLRIEQREVDMLSRAGAIPMGQRAEDRDGRVEPGENVSHGDPDFYRPAAGGLIAVRR